MKRQAYPKIQIAMATLLVISAVSSARQNITRPNIIYILADDLGYGDIGCYGQQYIKTPNIDRMAAEGIRFTQHYSGAPVSAPARCCLLTGRHTGHSYVRNNLEVKDDFPFETGQLPIPEGTQTIARQLNNDGYATAFIGKWGLGSIASEGAPLKQGFDFFYGYADQMHAHNHYPEYLWKNDKQVFLTGNVETVHPKIDKTQQVDSNAYKMYIGEQYSLDLMTCEAVNYIKANRENPFFLYMAYVTPHKALQVPEEDLVMYKNIFNEKSYDGKKGYTPHAYPLSAYAAMITRMDKQIGLILNELKQIGLDENTIVMFSSDNGPAGGSGLDARFFNSSGGLRGMKGQVYEGGIREPFIVRWPGKIKPNTVTDHVSTQYDLMATLAEIIGRKPVETDGISFLPTLLGQEKKQRQHAWLYWEFSSGGGQYAVRIGDWKGVCTGVSKNQRHVWELYNLASDRAESISLADQHPELVEKCNQIVKLRTPSHIEEWNFDKLIE